MPMKRLTLCFLLFAASLAFGQGDSPAVAVLSASASACQPSTNLTACVFLPIPKTINTVGISLAGTFSGTFQFEGSVDGGATWVSVSASPAPSGAAVTSATATGTWTLAVAGYSYLRVRCSAYTSGSATATLNPSQAVAAGSGGGFTAGVSVGTPGAAYASGTVTAAIAATTLCSTTNCPAGTYLVSIYGNETGTGCTTVGSGAMIPEVNFVDNQAVSRANVKILATTAGAGSAAPTGMSFTTGGTNFANSAAFVVNTNGTAVAGSDAIQILTAFTACTTPGPWTGYQLRAYVVRIN